MTADLRVHVAETFLHIHRNPQHRHPATPVKLTDKRKTAITRLQYDPNHRTTVYRGIGYSDASRNQNFPPR